MYNNEHDIIAELRGIGYVVLKSAFEWQEIGSNSIMNARFGSASTSTSFYYSLLNNNKDNNVMISSLVIQQFKKALSSLLPRYRLLAGSFLIKPASDYSEFYLHQDWSYTDEKLFTPITAWSPLIDTSEKSGGMFFLEGSHNYFQTIRSKSYNTARFSLSEIGRENINGVDVQKGDILLFNPAIWHGSFPNTLPVSRKVFTCLLLPQDAPFYYYQKFSDETALRYKIPDYAMEHYLSDIVNADPAKIFREGEHIQYNFVRINACELIEEYKLHKGLYVKR